MCIHCGDLPTWRYHFANGQTFTSSMARDFADAQANAHGVEIVAIEQYDAGDWLPLKARSEDGNDG